MVLHGMVYMKNANYWAMRGTEELLSVLINHHKFYRNNKFIFMMSRRFNDMLGDYAGGGARTCVIKMHVQGIYQYMYLAIERTFSLSNIFFTLPPRCLALAVDRIAPAEAAMSFFSDLSELQLIAGLPTYSYSISRTSHSHQPWYQKFNIISSKLFFQWKR